MVGRRREGRRPATQGVAILAFVIVIGILIVNVGTLLRFREDTYELVGLAPEIAGVQRGTVVMIAGKEVGRVTAVQIHPPVVDTLARFAIHMELDRAAKAMIRHDSEMRVVRQRLMGPVAIQIWPGTEAVAPLRDGDTIPPRPAPSPEFIARDIAAIRAGLDTFMVAGRVLQETAAPDTGAFLRLFQQVDAARAELDRLAAAIRDGSAADFARDPAWRDALAGIRSGAAALRATRVPIHDPLDATALQSLLEQLRDHVAAVEERLAEPRGFPPRLRQDTAIAHAAARVRAQLDTLIAETRRNPLRFFF